MEGVCLALVLLVVLVALWYFGTTSSKVCIVSLVKDPHQFQTWIDHHRQRGVDKFYIFLDDDQEELGVQDPRLIIVRNWKDRLGFKWDPKKDEPANRNEKQRLAFEEGSRMAERDGIRYIIHIDSDELLYGKHPVEVFSRWPDSHAFHFKNEEMAPDRDDYMNCFKDGKKFHGDPTKFIAYGNGKSAGVAGKATWFGPHYMKGQGQREIPPEDLRVLHYPSCNLDETLKRARQYGNFQDNSAGWSGHHKETRDVLMNCGTECYEKAREQFRKRMAGPDAVTFQV
jgi:hypothetical protein